MHSPHLSHSDPWAHAHICCDTPHSASTSYSPQSAPPVANGFSNHNGFNSAPQSRVSSPVTMGPTGHHQRGASIASASSLRNAQDSRAGESGVSGHQAGTLGPPGVSGGLGKCADGSCCRDAACERVECCVDPGCSRKGDRCEEPHPEIHVGGNASSKPQIGMNSGNNLDLNSGGTGIPTSAEDEELMRWACSKEGCEAIEQYLKCCTLPNCDLPAIPPPLPMYDDPIHPLRQGNSGPSSPPNSATSSGMQPPPIPSAHLNHHHHVFNPDANLSGRNSSGNTANALVHNGFHIASDSFSNAGMSSTGQAGQNNFPALHIHQRPLSQFSFPNNDNNGRAVVGRQLNGFSSTGQHNHGLLHHGHSHFHSHSHSHSNSHSHSHSHLPSIQTQLHNSSHQHSHVHNHRHGHSHSASIASLGPSTVTSPDLMPWSTSTAQTPISSSTQTTPAASMIMPTHICHWQNCHLTFSSMPDLLAHVAADHLGAPVFGPSNPLPSHQQDFPMVDDLSMGDMVTSAGMGVGNMPPSNVHSTNTTPTSGSVPDLSGLGFGMSLPNTPDSQYLPNHQTQSGSRLINMKLPSPGVQQTGLQLQSQLTAAQTIQSQNQNQSQIPNMTTQNEVDHLLSCLWDDCFPLPTECSADPPNHCPPHTHIPAPSECHVPHPHSHTHTHLPVSGTAEAFSPQTMLRHVLEEHLGVPGEIVGWDDQTIGFGLGLPGAVLGHPSSANGGDGDKGRIGTMNPGELKGLPMLLGTARNAVNGFTLPESAISALQDSQTASRNGSLRDIQHANPAIKPISTSSTPPDAKPLICQWHECKSTTHFATPAELMDHLSEEHIGRGKDCYECKWAGCIVDHTPPEEEDSNEDSNDRSASVSAKLGSGSGDDNPLASGSDSKNSEASGTEPRGRVFRSRQKVLRHLQSHTGYKPYVCHICQQAFSEAAPLQAHLRRHKEEKPFVCEVEGCGKRFAISSSLTIHMRTHNGEKPFVCPHCQKGFVEASNLTKHIRTHTGERPFVCPHPGCDKRFPRPDQLKRHVAIHEREGGKKGKRQKIV